MEKPKLASAGKVPRRSKKKVKEKVVSTAISTDQVKHSQERKLAKQATFEAKVDKAPTMPGWNATLTDWEKFRAEEKAWRQTLKSS